MKKFTDIAETKKARKAEAAAKAKPVKAAPKKSIWSKKK